MLPSHCTHDGRTEMQRMSERRTAASMSCSPMTFDMA